MRKEKTLRKSFMQRMKSIYRFAVMVLTPIAASGIVTCLILIFIKQIFTGAVDAALALLVVVYAAILTAWICRGMNTQTKEDISKELWVQLTTEIMAFVAKGQMTQREASHILRAMRYVARKNGWKPEREGKTIGGKEG